MEASDRNRRPPFHVLTVRDGQEVIAQNAGTEVGARTRFASVIELCTSRYRAHEHRVELCPRESRTLRPPGTDSQRTTLSGLTNP